MDIWAEYEERMKQQERFRNLTIKEQLNELQCQTQENDVVIGKIFVKNPPAFENRHQLKSMLGNASLVKEVTVGGQGDTTIELIFAVNNLLIGVAYFAYWRAPFSMIKECKVYRFQKTKSLKELDLDNVKRSLF